MSAAAAVAQSGAFVPGEGGSRFRLVSEPAAGPLLGTIVWVHAFAEEMNKTRRMSARMARLLAAAGWRVVQPDLHGCGDSAGEFREASWAGWTAELATELSLADDSRPVWLWCVRAGALLAPALLSERPALNLLLWQPVVSGAQHLQQFLRLNVGARIVGAGPADGPTPAQMLRSGATVEVGGYELHPALTTGLEQARFDVPDGHAGRVVWFEVSADEPTELSPQAARTVGQLRARGLAVDAESLSGPPFWQTQEIEQSEALLGQTLLRLSSTLMSGDGGLRA